MYQLPNTLRNFAFVLIFIGAVGVIYSFLTVPTLEEVKLSHPAKTEIATQSTHNSVNDANDEHALHVLHQLQNRPWAALYVAIFFFMMIAATEFSFFSDDFLRSKEPIQWI